MNADELREHLLARGGHNMDAGHPYNINRLRTRAALEARHVQDHAEEQGFVGHSHEGMEPDVVPHDLGGGWIRGSGSDEAPGMLISELFDIPPKPRIQRVFNDRRYREEGRRP